MQEQEPKQRRRDAGALQVTERDTIALSWIAEQFCIAFDQLQRLLGRYAKAETKTPNVLSISATRDAVSRWLQLGFIEEPRKITSRYPPYIWLSRRGLAQLGLPYAYYRPQVSNARHIYAVNNVRLHLESYRLKSLWHPERSLSRETTQRPLPDAELQSAGTAHTAIKVLATPFKYDISIKNEIDTLVGLSRYTSLWYFLHPDTVEPLQRALTSLSQNIRQRITLYGLNTQMLPDKKQTSSIRHNAILHPQT